MDNDNILAGISAVARKQEQPNWGAPNPLARLVSIAASHHAGGNFIENSDRPC